MKIKEVPQDNAGFLKEGKVRDVCYAVDENGKYTQVLSVGWDPKNDAIKQTWQHIHEKADKIKQKVLQGKLSPLAYYMEKNMLTVSLAAKYTGFSRYKIWCHRKPRGFSKISSNDLIIYAEILGVDPDTLTKIE